MRPPQWFKKLSDANLPRAIIKHAVMDFQLDDLFAKAKTLVGKANPTFVTRLSKDSLPTKKPTNKTPLKKARLKKTPSKESSLKKTITKKAPSKKKTKRQLPGL